MRRLAFALGIFGLALSGCATTTARPGSELVGQSLRVEGSAGPPTLLAFAADGTVTGSTNGNRATGRWEVANRRICLTFERTGRECFPYLAPFRRGQTVTLTGSSGVTVRATLQ